MVLFNYIVVWSVIHKCGSAKLSNLQNAGYVLSATKKRKSCMQALKHSLRLAEKQLETSKPIPVTYMQTLTERLTAWKLPKRKLRLVAVRSKTQVAFGMFFGCMNATCWKSGDGVNLACVRRCIDTEPCDTQESVERYIRAHILCVLGTVVLPDKSTTSLNSKIQLGVASLAHLYRSLCHASRFNCKEIDGSLILLFVWEWERMPIPIIDVGLPLARLVESLAPAYKIHTEAYFAF
ncbi:hypothetical protein Ahy_B07g087206 [Arachis hypogaea]|uniref:Aminotransferase-like plant mobile domain-containing protein n=1 Tax=Arachis hypogaea TaxID=3818 RepID=A0A444YBK9_ARAHY|nr:hypothetical protein Ahy_B07g087206 [Arachis hypogaea]